MGTKYQVIMDIEVETENSVTFDIGEAVKKKLNCDLLWPADLSLTDRTIANGFSVKITNPKTSAIVHFKVMKPRSDNYERIGRLVKFITPERLQLKFDDDGMFIYSLVDIIEVP